MSGPRVRYWPSLYDRLRKGDATGLDDQFVDSQDLRDQVRRNLEDILNTTPLESCTDLSAFPHVRRSALNFGAADLPGRVISGISVWQLRERLSEALRCYEPRIAPDSIAVSVAVRDDDDPMVDPERNVSLSIFGMVYGTPEELVRLRAELDVALGEATLQIE